MSLIDTEIFGNALIYAGRVFTDRVLGYRQVVLNNHVSVGDIHCTGLRLLKSRFSRDRINNRP